MLFSWVMMLSALTVAQEKGPMRTCRSYFASMDLCYDDERKSCAWPIALANGDETRDRLPRDELWCATLRHGAVVECVSFPGSVCLGDKRAEAAFEWLSKVVDGVAPEHNPRFIAFSTRDLTALGSRARVVATRLAALGTPLLAGAFPREDSFYGLGFLPDITFSVSRGFERERRRAVDPEPSLFKAVWRGAPSSADLLRNQRTASTWDLQRLRVCYLAATRPDLLDARLSHQNYPLLTRRESTAAQSANLTSATRASDAWVSRHSVQISIDGFGTTAGYFRKLLHGRAVVVKVASGEAAGDVIEFWYHLFRPWVHFLPVRGDVDDLLSTIEWALRHRDEAVRVAAAGRTRALRVDYETSVCAGRLAIFGDTPPFPREENSTPEAMGLLSNVFGNGAVLQRGRPARIWGRTVARGANVTITLDNKKVGMATSGKRTRVWSFDLPAMVGSSRRHEVQVREATLRNSTSAAALLNVLFGDVFLCLGQSNLAPSKLGYLSTRDDGTSWELVRVLSIFQPPGDAHFCEREGGASRWELPENRQWTSMVNESQRARAASATCLAFAARVQRHTDAPVGIINSAVGSTFIEQWLPPYGSDRAFQALPLALGGASACFNATVAPFARGPMQLSGFVLWLGESYAVAGSQFPRKLGRLFRRLVADLRAAFGDPCAYAGFARLSSFCDRRALALPYVRHSQMEALDLPNVAYATAEDVNEAPCDLHPAPRSKTKIGARLAESALDLVFGTGALWRAPEVLSVDAPTYDTSGCVSVRVDLRYVARYVTVRASIVDAALRTQNRTCDGGRVGCHSATISLEGGRTLSAEISVLGPGSLVFRACRVSRHRRATHVHYGWAAVPLLTVHDAHTSLPLVPFRVRLPRASRGSTQAGTAPPVLQQHVGKL